MSEMVERVARAIHTSAYAGEWDDLFDRGVESKEQFLNMARAAIEAMREPTEAMITSWQPISSRPTDGRQVLLWSPKGQHFIAPALAALPAAKVRDVQAQIYAATGTWPDHGWDPTHWMDLPGGPGSPT